LAIPLLCEDAVRGVGRTLESNGAKIRDILLSGSRQMQVMLLHHLAELRRRHLLWPGRTGRPLDLEITISII